MATKKSQQEVATRQEQAVTAFSTETPDYIKQGQNRGSEEVGARDMVLPRLEIVQAMSKFKDENEDAREGDMYNSVTQENLGDLVYFVPVFFRAEYLVWKDYDEGGGFGGAFNTEADAKAKLKEMIEGGEDPALWEVVDTPVHYGLRITPDGVMEQIVLSMAKTKAKVSRKWNALIQINGGDRFSRVYKLTTFKDENKKGQKFHNFVVQPAGFAPKQVYEQAEQLYTVFKNQEIRVAHETVIDGAEGGLDRDGI